MSARERTRAAEQAAFLRRIEPDLPRAFRFLVGMGLRPAESEALLFQAACALWRSPAGLRERPLGDALLARSAALCVRRLERGQARVKHGAPLRTEPSPALARRGSWPPAGRLGERTRRKIRAGVKALPPLHRAAFLLCDVDHLAPGAAARALDLSSQRVQTLRHQARVAMVAAVERAVAREPERG